MVGGVQLSESTSHMLLATCICRLCFKFAVYVSDLLLQKHGASYDTVQIVMTNRACFSKVRCIELPVCLVFISKSIVARWRCNYAGSGFGNLAKQRAGL